MEDKTHPISCAILGLGRIGYDTHFRRLLNDDRFKVVAIADGVLERRQAALGAGVEHVFADAAQLIGRLSEFSIELVINALPTGLHVPLAERVLRVGCHTVVEKPLAPDREQARALMDLAHEFDHCCLVHHNYRLRCAPIHQADA